MTRHISISPSPRAVGIGIGTFGTGSHSSLYSTAQYVSPCAFCQLSQGPTSCLTWGRSMGREVTLASLLWLSGTHVMISKHAPYCNVPSLAVSNATGGSRLSGPRDDNTSCPATTCQKRPQFFIEYSGIHNVRVKTTKRVLERKKGQVLAERPCNALRLNGTCLTDRGGVR